MAEKQRPWRQTCGVGKPGPVGASQQTRGGPGRRAGPQLVSPGVAGAVESGWARYFLLGISAFDGKF